MKINIEGTWEEIQLFCARIACKEGEDGHTADLFGLGMPEDSERELSPMQYRKLVDDLTKMLREGGRGKLISAIKVLREATKCTLKGSKDWIEKLYAAIGSPEGKPHA